GERRPDLLPAHDVVVAVADRAGPGHRHVGARRRLGVAGRPDLVGGQDGRDEPSLLLVGTVAHDGRTDPPDRHRVQDPRGARAGELLVEDRLLHVGETRAAVLLGPRGADEARGVERSLPGAERLDILARDWRGDVGREPGADAGAERFLVGAVREIHDDSSGRGCYRAVAAVTRGPRPSPIPRRRLTPRPGAGKVRA